MPRVRQGLEYTTEPVYPCLRLTCSSGHTFYLPGVTDRLGKMHSHFPMQVNCPFCSEALAGGAVLPAAGFVLSGGQMVKDEEVGHDGDE